MHGRGPSKINLDIFVCSFDVCRASIDHSPLSHNGVILQFCCSKNEAYRNKRNHSYSMHEMQQSGPVFYNLAHCCYFIFVIATVPNSRSIHVNLCIKGIERDASRKKAAQDPGSEKLTPRISRGHFLLAGFFCVSLDGLRERGTTRSLDVTTQSTGCCVTLKAIENFSALPNQRNTKDFS